MKWLNHWPSWGIPLIILLILGLPRAIQRANKSTVAQRLGDKTCELYKNGAGLSQRQAFLTAWKELGLTQDTKYTKGTESDLPEALAKCGITISSLNNDSP